MTSDTLQLGQSSVPAHWRQKTAVAKPRRLSRISDCSPAFEAAPSASRSARLENHVRPLGGVFVAHVDDGHRGERPVEHAPLEHDALVLPGHRVVITLHRRRRRTEDDQRAGALAANDRDVAPVVARTLVLLVRTVVLLVDDDQADAIERREHRRPRADDDVHVAAADALPLIVTLAVGESAVLDRDAVAKGVAEERGDRRRQRDFRDERSASRRPRGADARQRAQIDLGLAAARDAVQQRDAKLLAVGDRPQPLERRCLLARQLTAPSLLRPSLRSTSSALPLTPSDPHRERIAVEAVARGR